MTNTDIYNLRKEIQTLAINAQDLFYAQPNIRKNKISYLVLGDIYDHIITLNTEEEIRNYALYLVDQSNKYRKIYDSKYDEYNRESDMDKKNAKARELNEIVARINAYNTSYNVINKYLSKETKRIEKPVPVIEPEKKVRPVVTKKVEVIKEEPKKIQQPVISTPKVTYTTGNADIDLSNKIIVLLEKDHSLEEESDIYRKQIFTLRNEREEKYKVIPNYRVLLTELDSLENMISISTNNKVNEMNLGREDFVKELRSTLNAINEYYFKDELAIKKYYRKNPDLGDKKNEALFLKKYNNYVRKFHVLIYSLFKNNNISFKLHDEVITTDDLLAYLSTCNLDGDFKVYSSKFGGNKIGVEDATKKNYEKTLKYLNECISTLCLIVQEKIQFSKIKLVDNEITNDDLIKQRDKKISELNEILARTKGGTHAIK